MPASTPLARPFDCDTTAPADESTVPVPALWLAPQSTPSTRPLARPIVLWTSRPSRPEGRADRATVAASHDGSVGWFPFQRCPR
jgi:hypothetical protein